MALTTPAWVVVSVAHETWLVQRTAVTPGHTNAGLVIVSRKGGGPPGTLRSFLRAMVLGLTVYVPHGNHYYPARAWSVRIGRVTLYLLDTDFEGNAVEHRVLTRQLYGGNQ